MKTLKDCEYSRVVAGVVSAKFDDENPKATVGPKEDFIQGIFFTLGSLIAIGIRDIIFRKDRNKEESDAC
jgi:hypothetical protein